MTLTRCNKKLIIDTRMIHVVNCCSKNCSENFQIRENRLKKKENKKFQLK